MKKEYQLIFIIGLFVFAYVLDALVDPMELNLPSPYHYLFSPDYIVKYAFSSASIIVKTLGVVWSILWSITFIDKNYTLKMGIVLVLSALIQLYSLQSVVTDSYTIPLEWALTLSLSGLILIPVIFFYLLRNIFNSGNKNPIIVDNGPLPDSLLENQKPTSN